MAGRTERERETCADDPCHCPASPSLRHACPLVGARLGAEIHCLEDRPRERTAVGWAETARRGWSVVWPQPGVFTAEALIRHRSEEPLLSDAQREGRGCHYSLFLHALAPTSVGSRRTRPSHRLGAPVSMLLCPSCHLSQLQEQKPVGCPLTEVGLKPQLSPRGHVT